MKFQKQ